MISEVRKCLITNRGKCSKQFVLIVEKNAKFHSNRKKADLYFAENVLLKREDIDEETEAMCVLRNNSEELK